MKACEITKSLKQSFIFHYILQPYVKIKDLRPVSPLLLRIMNSIFNPILSTLFNRVH